MKAIVRNITVLTLMLLILFSLDSVAQENKVLDGIFIKETNPTRRVVPYTNVREADVMFYKRVWREIDIREKVNHPLYYPHQPIHEIGYVRLNLFEILKRGIDEGTITAYDVTSDGFEIELNKTEAADLLSYEVVTYDEDLNTGEIMEIIAEEPIGGNDIAKYWIKEDWVFDRQRSVMEVRIIGILPIINTYNEDGTVRAPKGLFWIYYPEARYVLANQEVYNESNDGSRLTFNDFFEKRVFSSYIRQETNVHNNRTLDAYTNGVDRLLESQEIENNIVNYEHDLWHF